jgi:hypothetical protein
VNQVSRMAQLASGRLTELDGLSIELHQPPEGVAYILVLWPLKPTRMEPTPKAIADITSNLVRVMSHAHAALVARRQEPERR